MKNNQNELTKIKSTVNQIKKIEFLFDGSASNTSIEDLKKNQLASVRLRTSIAAEAAHHLKYEVICSDGHHRKYADIIFVGKVNNINDTHRPSRWLQRISKMKASGSKIFIDYTDHHLEENTTTGEFYRKSLKFADAVICSSIVLKEFVSQIFSGPIYLIEEPVEIPIQKPSNKNSDIKNILWFGHASNLSYLFDCLLNIFNNKIHARLILMTNAYPFPEEYSKLLAIDALENIEINVVPWSNEDLVKAANICDFCILPTGYKDARKAGASSNRLLTAFALGLPVLTDKLASYQKFSDYFETLSTDNLVKFCSEYSYDFEKIQSAQFLINAQYSKDNMMKNWGSLFEDQCQQTISLKTTPLIKKLNLGCGDKILDGYINVDVVESRAGKNPDVICDLHDLSIFESNSVDEILAVHVIEHFWQWEVVDILKEWTRVLKPGGKMILECPNLVSAAEEFLKNPDLAAIGGPEGQRSMWVFYGDPGWKDPLMIHRWGYTPKSLATIMSSAGLIDLKQEPAQFKLREPRDMRITGKKKVGIFL